MSEWGMGMEQAARLPERHALHLMAAYKERKLFEGRAHLMAQVDARKPPTPSLGAIKAMGIKVKDGRNAG